MGGTRVRLTRIAVGASLAVSLMAATALGLSLTPAGSHALRSVAAAAGNRSFPWAPVALLADTTCQPPTTSGGGTPPPTTSGGGTPPPTTSGGGTPPPTTSGGGTPPPTTSGGGTCAPPAVVISPSATAVCQGGSVTLTAIPSGGALPETFAWTSSDASFSSTSQTVSVSPTATTSYTVTVTDSTGSTATGTITINVNPLPLVTISGTPAGAIVLGTIVSLIGLGSGGSGSYSYAWTKGGVPFATGATLRDTPGMGDTTYAVTAADANGCSASMSTTVGVFDYTINLSPSDETVLAGTPATYVVSAAFVAGSHTAGAPSSLSLGISGAPGGATVTAPASISLPSAGPIIVNTSISSLGDFTIVASASVGGATRMASAGLHIYDFALSVTPPTQTVTLGGGPATYTVSAALLPGSTAVGLPASVGLRITGLPGTVTPTMPAALAFGASVPLSLAIGSTAPGDYPFAVSGSVPGGARTATAHLVIAYNICVLYDQTQVKKAGTTIPIKLQLCDANGANVSAPNIVVHAVFVQMVSGVVPPVVPDDSGNANPDNDFRFDGTIGTTGGYIFNLSTMGLTAGVWTLTFTAGSDPTLHSVQFLLR